VASNSVMTFTAAEQNLAIGRELAKEQRAVEQEPRMPRMDRKTVRFSRRRRIAPGFADGLRLIRSSAQGPAPPGTPAGHVARQATTKAPTAIQAGARRTGAPPPPPSTRRPVCRAGWRRR
jgi:hypothetical protein